MTVRTRAANTRSLGSVALRRAYRVEVGGAATMPSAGGIVLAVSGRGPVVGPLLATALPRPVHALGMPESLGGLGRGIGASRRARALLREGAVVAVPVHEADGRALAAFLALDSGVPIQPVIVRGAHGRFEADPPRLRSRVTMAVLPPVLLIAPGDPCAWDVVRGAAEQVRQHCADAERATRSQDGMGTS